MCPNTLSYFTLEYTRNNYSYAYFEKFYGLRNMKYLIKKNKVV